MAFMAQNKLVAELGTVFLTF